MYLNASQMGSAAVHVVVPEPASLDHPETEQEGGEPPGWSTRSTARRRTARPPAQRPHLLEHVALEEAVLLELVTELAERHRHGVLLRRGGLILDGGRGIALGELAEAIGRLGGTVGAVGVERVEGVGAVATVEEVDPALAAGVRLGPSSAIVPLVVDLDAHGLTLRLDVGGDRGLGAGEVFVRCASVRGLGASCRLPRWGPRSPACGRERGGPRARGRATARRGAADRVRGRRLPRRTRRGSSRRPPSSIQPRLWRAASRGIRLIVRSKNECGLRGDADRCDATLRHTRVLVVLTDRARRNGATRCARGVARRGNTSTRANRNRAGAVL